jgi:D-3-phosphoglycerate dehydrogenase
MPARILVTDDIDADGVAVLTAQPGFQVDEVPTLSREQLLERIGEYDALIGRSATRLPAEVLRRGERLRVIGRAGVGIDNIDLDAATTLGVAVINAPAGNTVAVAELFFGALIGLLREIPRAATSMHEGRWDRAQFPGRELRRRRLGIVGVGRIGSEVAQRALAFGMQVTGYDPYITDQRFETLRIERAPTLDALLTDADVLTIHTPLTEETRGLIGRRELLRLPSQAVVVNLARGGIVDEAALAAALTAGHVSGAVIDVFEQEPLRPDHPLRTTPHVLLTPHLGASTMEAQRNVAVDVCEAVRDALLTGDLSRTINMAGMGAASWRDLPSGLFLARRAATAARAILAGQGAPAIQRLSVRCSQEFAEVTPALLAAAAAGVLDGILDTDRLNLINARALAEARGIELSVSVSSSLGQAHALQVSVSGAMKEIAVAGVATPGLAARLTRIGGFHIDVSPRQTLVILTNHDVPGVIGRVGTLLGNASVNIAEYHQARLAQGGEALAAIAVDGSVDESVRQQLLTLPDVLSATIVRFRDG